MPFIVLLGAAATAFTVIACSDDEPLAPAAPSATPIVLVDVRGGEQHGVTPPHLGHSHYGLDEDFHRTLIYGEGYGEYRDGERQDDCAGPGRDDQGPIPCIDHRFWYSWVQEHPERLNVVVDVTNVYRESGRRADGWRNFEVDRRCRVRDLRTLANRRGRQERFVETFTNDTGRLVREATGRQWTGHVARRAPGAYRRPETVVVRFVIDGCGGNDETAACATYGDGGWMLFVVNTDCTVRTYGEREMRELYAHELGHTLGFRHPDSTDRRDEMISKPADLAYNGHAGFSRREQRHMQHAYLHGRGYRGRDERHVEGRRRHREWVWVID